MLGIALALASAASWGTADFLGGLTTKQLSILVVSAVSQFAGLVFMVLILLVLARGPADGHVIVLGLAAGVCGVIGLAEPIQYSKRVGIDIAAREYVLGARNDPRFGHRAALYQHVADAT